MKKVRVGIIGAGRIGRIHARNLQMHSDAEVIAISDVFAGSELREWAESLGITRVSVNAEDWIGDPDIDAVFICSPTDTHVSLIKMAAQSGKHIFCEKPVSMDLHQTRSALEAVRQAGVKLQVGFNRRFDRNFRKIRELTTEGKTGKPYLIRITSRDPQPPSEMYIKSSGGMYMDMSIHDFDMVRFLSGSEAEEIYACGSVLVDPVFRQYSDVDTAVITIRLAGGVIAVIDNSRQAAYGYDQRIELFGSGGSASCGNEHPNTVQFSGPDGIVSDKPLHFFLERYAAAYMEETEQFIRCILEGLEVPVSGEDAYEAERMALAAALSGKLGRPVKMSELEEGSPLLTLS